MPIEKRIYCLSAANQGFNALEMAVFRIRVNLIRTMLYLLPDEDKKLLIETLAKGDNARFFL